MLEPIRRNPKVASAGFKHTRALTETLVGTSIAAFLGSTLWLFLPGPRLNWSEVWPAVGFGAFFGGWVGLISCLCFGFIRKVRHYGTRSPLRMILVFVLLGGIAGAPVFFPFGDGLAMALGLAMEAAVFGAIIGAILGLIFLVVMFRRKKDLSSDH